MAATDSSADVLAPNTRAAAAKARSKKESELRLKRAQRASILLKHVSDATRLQIILFLPAGERKAMDEGRWAPARLNGGKGKAGRSPARGGSATSRPRAREQPRAAPRPAPSREKPRPVSARPRGRPNPPRKLTPRRDDQTPF